MKKYIYIIGVTLLTVMTACTAEDLVPQQTDKLDLSDGDLIEQITFTVPDLISDEAQTKGSYMFSEIDSKPNVFWWNSKDTIGVFALNQGQYGWQRADQVYFPYTSGEAGELGNTAFFDGAGWGLRTGYKYGAYYPYKFENRDYRKIEIDYSNQNNIMNDYNYYLSNYDFMASGAITPTDKSLRINLKRLGAIARFKIDLNDAFEEIDEIIFKEMILQTNKQVFAVKNTLDLTKETPELTNVEKASSISVALGGKAGNNSYDFRVYQDMDAGYATIKMALPPTDLSGETLQVVMVDEYNRRFTAQLEGKNIEAGKFYNFEVSATQTSQVITNPNIIAAIEAQKESLELPIEYTSEGYIYPYGEWASYLTSLDLSNKHDPTIADELPLLYLLNDLDVSGNDLERLDVSDLTGLTRLICNNNNLTELILPTIQNWNDIVELSAMRNQLTSLNLDNCRNLEYLYLEDNQLPYVNVSKCTKLKRLAVDQNKLTSIDVSNNQMLEGLDLTSNLLTSVDVSDNLMLTDLLVGRNNLDGLDIGHLTSLLRLDVYECGLTSIDLSTFTDLIYLDVQGNNLTSLDLSANKKLEYLLCSFNPISGSLNLNIEAGFTQLKEVYCSGTNLSTIYLDNLPNLTKLEARDNTYLTLLDCTQSNISNLYVDRCTYLQQVYCAFNNLTYLNLSTCPRIKCLECEENKLYSLGLNISSISGYDKFLVVSCYGNRLSTIDLSNSDLKLWSYDDTNLKRCLNVGAQVDYSSNPRDITLYVPSDIYDTEAKRTALQELLRSMSYNQGVVVAIK